ncbi:MAG: neutral/alkaline non-lysosomal ceramidase N-terminal domain-containing protein [Gemmataceae bacterium]
MPSLCQAGELRAGASVIDITPPNGFPMWGYAARKDAPSVGIREKLQARALVLELGGKRLALVGLDLGRAPTRQSTATIREQVRRLAAIDFLFLVGSHTHHGPILELDNWPTPENSYVRNLESNLTKLIVEAAQSLRPARFGVGSTETNLNRNRHSKRGDSPVDRELLVLRVEGKDGKPIAIAVNFAAHPTMIDAKDRSFSPDYVGRLCAMVQKETGAPCIFLQGAAGDLSPRSPREKMDYQAFGDELAKKVLALAKSLECRDPDSVSLTGRDETFRFPARVDLRNPLWRFSLSSAFYPAFITFYEREYREGVRPSLTTVLLDNRIGFVGVSGEFFCGHALHLRRRARLPYLFFLGYCNDYQQYFPTIEAASEGGYGTEPYIGTAEIGAGERIMDRALIHLYEMREKPK